LAQLDRLAAAVEADTNDRDACAVAVAVRELVKLARQPAPEGARLTPTRTADGAGLRWHLQETAPSEPPRLSPAHVALVGIVLGVAHVLADAQDHAGALRGQLREACNDSDDPILLEASEIADLLSLDLEMLGHETVACAAELTGNTEGSRSRSLLSAAMDLYDLHRDARERDAASQTALREARQRFATAHFRRT